MKDTLDLFNFNSLYNSCNLCSINVKWKKSVQHYILNQLEETYKLEQDIKNDTYKHRSPKVFKVYIPKEREVLSIPFRDRLYQRILNDKLIYPTITKSFVCTNSACQKGKGTDFARNTIKKFLRRYYETYGNNKGFIIHLDIKKYYASLSHKISESIFSKAINEDYFKLVKDILKVYPDDYGYKPGSQMVQILGLAYLNKIDHFIKEKLKVKFYVRYMDDLILIVKDTPQFYINEIEKELNKVELKLNKEKTKIKPLSQGDTVLGFKFLLNDKGKVYQIIPTKCLRRIKRRIKHRAGKQSLKEFDESFSCYYSYINKAMNKKAIFNLIVYYNNIRSIYYDI